MFFCDCFEDVEFEVGGFDFGSFVVGEYGLFVCFVLVCGDLIVIFVNVVVYVFCFFEDCL